MLLFYITTTLLVLFYYYVKWAHSYWKRKGVEYIEPEFFFGNITESIAAKPKVHRGEAFEAFYNYFKEKGLKYGGVYKRLTPMFVIVDLELAKAIVQNDFNHFINHDQYVNEKNDPLTGNLFNLRNEKWRDMRAKLTPTFSSGKMKMMFNTLVECNYALEKLLNEYVATNEPVEVRDVCSRFTIQIISSVAFGVEVKTLEDPDSMFLKIGNKIISPSRSPFSRFMVFLVELIPEWVFGFLNIKLSNKEIENFFMKWVKNLVEYREKNDVFRKDFMHLMIQLKNRNDVFDDDKLTTSSKKDSYLSIEQITAQSFVFFVAGFETSSSVMSFALMNLALDQDIQDKLRAEINKVLKAHGDKITYEAIMEMEYLEQVSSETLRIHSPATALRRICNADYKVPNSDLVIEKGTLIRIPIQGFHRDETFFPNPKKFDPDRFSAQNKQKIPAFSYMPFGEGPRSCIGLRFAKLQTKVGLVSFIKNFRVTMSEKTQLPIKIVPHSFTPMVVGGLWLNIEKI